MQHGDFEIQSAENSVKPTENPETSKAAECVPGKPGLESIAGNCPDSETAIESSASASEVTLHQSRTARLSTTLGSLWKKLRNQRREAAAVVVLIVMALFWLDVGKSRTESSPKSLDPLAGFESALSDFAPVSDGQQLKESADPFDSLSPNSFNTELYFPPANDLSASTTAATNNRAGTFGGSTPSATARYPDDASAFNANATRTSGSNGAEQQHDRKVKFAGRIQPAY